MRLEISFIDHFRKWRPDPFWIMLAIVIAIFTLAIWINMARSEVAWDSFTDEQIVNAIFWAEGEYKATYLYGIRSGWTDTEIVEAIWKAEGGAKATYAYGIRSVKYKDKAEARRICFNTVRNQRRRHKAHDCKLTYLECLSKRYAPIGCDNDTGSNKFWLKNIKYFLNEKTK